jgi:hypothetical protein
MGGNGALHRQAAAARRGLFAEPDFRRLWFVGLVVFLVRWLETLVTGLFTWNATGSAFLVATMTMLRLLPMGLFGAFLGAWAERVEGRTALLLTVFVSLLASLAMALLAGAGALAVWHLAALSFVNGLAWAADNPVRRLMIGRTVGADRMGAAMSVDVGTNNASRLLGPTLGGAILAGAGIGGAFWVSVALYAAALAAALALRARVPPRPPSGDGVLAQIGEGLAVVRRDRRLAGALLVTVVFNLFGWPFNSLVPVIGQGAPAARAGGGRAARRHGRRRRLRRRAADRVAGAAGRLREVLPRRHRALPGERRAVRAGPAPAARGRGAGVERLRRLRLQHHAGDPGVHRLAAGAAEPRARDPLGLHRPGADRLRPHRAARGGHRPARGLRGFRGRRVAGVGPHTPLVARPLNKRQEEAA